MCFPLLGKSFGNVNLFPHSQAGFRNTYSCKIALQTLPMDWKSSIDDGKIVGVFFWCQQRALETVNRYVGQNYTECSTKPILEISYKLLNWNDISYNVLIYVTGNSVDENTNFSQKDITRLYLFISKLLLNFKALLIWVEVIEIVHTFKR